MQVRALASGEGEEAMREMSKSGPRGGECGASAQHCTAQHQHGLTAAVKVTTSPRLQAALSVSAPPPPPSTPAAAAPLPHLIQSGQELLKQGLGLALQLLFRELGTVARGGRRGGRGPETWFQDGLGTS